MLTCDACGGALPTARAYSPWLALRPWEARLRCRYLRRQGTEGTERGWRAIADLVLGRFSQQWACSWRCFLANGDMVTQRVVRPTEERRRMLDAHRQAQALVRRVQRDGRAAALRWVAAQGGQDDDE